MGILKYSKISNFGNLLFFPVKQISCRQKESEKILETWKIRVATPVDLLLL